MCPVRSVTYVSGRSASNHKYFEIRARLTFLRPALPWLDLRLRSRVLLLCPSRHRNEFVFRNALRTCRPALLLFFLDRISVLCPPTTFLRSRLCSDRSDASADGSCGAASI